MSDYKITDQEGLVRSDNRGLEVKSSTLVRRGLDLISFLQPRIIQFPNDKSLGTLYIRDLNSHDEDSWEELGEACGNVTVPSSKEVSLQLQCDDLSSLKALRPDDLYELSF